MYLSSVSRDLQSWLRDNHLMTVYDASHLYLWDFNRTYSKVDRFVTKEVIVRRDGLVIGEYVGEDIIDTHHRSPGSYQVDIYYHLNIPQRYRDMIEDLTEDYAISLTPRERSILHLIPNDRGDLRATQ